MSRAISRRRGTAQEHESFTGALAELTVDTTNNRLVVHDGSTPGGHPAAPVAYVDDKASLFTEDLIETVGKGDALMAPQRPSSAYDDVGETGGGSPAVICLVWDGHSKEIREANGREASGFPAGGWKEICDARGIKLSFSVSGSGPPTQFWEDRMTRQQIRDLQDQDFEVMSHVDISTRRNSSAEDVEAYIKARKEFHVGEGFNVKNAIWFGGYSDPLSRSIIRKYYRSARGTGPSDNLFKPMNQYNLPVLALDNLNYNGWEPIFDRAMEMRMPLIIYGHPRTDEFYDEPRDDNGDPDAGGNYGWEKIVSLLDRAIAHPDYGKGDGVKIMTVDDMLDIHGNVIDIGTRMFYPSTAASTQGNINQFFRVAKTGEFWSDLLGNLDSMVLGRYGWTHNKPIALQSVVVGPQVAANTNSSYLTAIGREAFLDSEGDYCVAIGWRCGVGAKGEDSIYIGSGSGTDSEGDNVVFIGDQAGRNSVGIDCVLIGFQAGRHNNKEKLVAIGKNAGYQNIGESVTVIGNEAGQDNEGNQLAAIGNNAGRGNTGHDCVAIGRQALFSNTVDAVTGVGREAARNNTGSSSVGVGFQALYDNTGVQTTAIGREAGRNNTGSRGCYFGRKAGFGATGTDMLALGFEAGEASSAARSIFIGREAGKNVTTHDVIIVGNIENNANPFIRGDLVTGGIVLGAPDTAIADGDMGNNRLTFSLSGGNLVVKVKNGSGTVTSGTITLT